MNGKSKQRGFTLVEVIVVVAVIAILAAILTPYITKYIDDSRVAKARNETQVIGAAMASFYKDLGRWPNRNNNAANYNGVYAGTVAPTAAMGLGANGWAAVGAQWNALDTHLQTNGHTYPAPPLVSDVLWRGPYATQLPVDPWGRPYVVNALEFAQPVALAIPVWVMSAGPDGVLNTTVGPGGQTTPQGDDIGFRIR